ncbi:MAG: phosphate--acyl-ACP acyltransferase, partial [Clostridia bacterium]|nr:phosphate--acyl-ACP acyltransferase [Clostridia bacterium]
MKIVLDVFGGDNAPEEIVKGAVEALKNNEGFGMVLVGKKEEIESLLNKYEYAGNR